MALEIIRRAVWGARYANGAEDRNGKPIILRLPWSENWMHHTAGGYLPPTATVEQEHAEMRRIEQTGQDRFGQGISYTFLIFPSGRVYEGHSIDRRGAHTGGRNDFARAYCYPGNYSTHRLTTAQERATAALLQHNHDSDRCTRRTLNGGHRQLKATECPGDHAYARIAEINRLATGPIVRDSEPTSTPELEPIEMTGEPLFYAKGDKDPAVYLIKVAFDDVDQPLTRRHVGETEFAIATQAGAKVAVLAQAQFDAIPKVTGSR